MKIRPHFSNGKKYFELDVGKINGQRKRLNFTSRQAAENALAAAKDARRMHGDSALAVSAGELAMISRLRDRCAAAGTTIEQAVDYFFRHAPAAKVKSMLLSTAVENFLAMKKAKGVSRRGIETFRGALRSLARWLPAAMVGEVDRAAIERWLDGQGWSASTRNYRRGFARTFFKWAIREGFAHANPCDGIEDAKVIRGEVGTLTVDECERLLATARDEFGGRMLGYVALGMFCGIRRAELERMRWQDVNLSERTAIVSAAMAKTRARRVVDISANAAAWLEQCERDADRAIAPCLRASGTSGQRHVWKLLRHAAGIRAWPHNALRHTFASMHYALHQDEMKLQAQMGHESAAMLHRHYRALPAQLG